MKKKVISALLCAAMVATMLVGCGGSSNDSKSSGGDGKKLVYWAMWSKDEPQAKVIQDAIAKYTEDTGVEVDVQFKGRSGQREGLQPALDAKQTIDLFDEDVNRVNGSWGKSVRSRGCGKRLRVRARKRDIIQNCTCSI